MAKLQPQTHAIRALEADGWLVEVVERWMRAGNRTWRKDAWGGFDLWAIDPDGNQALIQVTSRSNVSSRCKKISELPALARLRKAQIGLYVWGWGPTVSKGDWLVVDLS